MRKKNCNRFSVQECWKREKSGGTRAARCPKGEGNQGRIVRGGPTGV